MTNKSLVALALFGSVAASPAMAIDHGPIVSQSFKFLDEFAEYQAVFDFWKAAWDPFFIVDPVTSNTFLRGFSFTRYAQGDDFDDVIDFTRRFIGETLFVSYTLPVPSTVPVLVPSTVPVPGPIAGAGLPLLAAGIAFAAWRRRRAAGAA